MDANSSINQEIKGEFVAREVLAFATVLVEYVLRCSIEDTNAPFSYDDILGEPRYEDSEGNVYTDEERDEKLEELNNQLNELEESLTDDEDNEQLQSEISELKKEIKILEDAEEMNNEIYEWWVVTGWLGSKLMEQGETVLSDGNNIYWGRCTTGQAILLDSVITKICEDLEILHGQKDAWK